jgi:hypothetical protein
MNNEKTIYEMTQAELNDQYRYVILKHREADHAYKLMRSGGDKKTKKSNWLLFENTYPPNVDEVEKIDFLNLMKAASNDYDANTAEPKHERAMEAFNSAYPAYTLRGHLPITPAKRAYDRYKTHYNAYSDLSDATLIAECEKVVLNSPDGPEYCFHIAHLTNEAWPEAERRIAESPWWSYMYAKMVLKGPFLDGEATIATSGQYAYRYAWFVIKDRFTQGEQAISQDPRASFFYAQRVIGGRFVLGEATILQAEKESGAPPTAVSLAAEYRKWCIKIGTPIVYSSNTVKEGVLS